MEYEGKFEGWWKMKKLSILILRKKYLVVGLFVLHWPFNLCFTLFTYLCFVSSKEILWERNPFWPLLVWSEFSRFECCWWMPDGFYRSIKERNIRKEIQRISKWCKLWSFGNQYKEWSLAREIGRISYWNRLWSSEEQENLRLVCISVGDSAFVTERDAT